MHNLLPTINDKQLMISILKEDFSIQMQIDEQKSSYSRCNKSLMTFAMNNWKKKRKELKEGKNQVNPCK